MKYSYSVKHNGKIYRPNEEVPELDITAEEKVSEGTGEVMIGIEAEVGEVKTLSVETEAPKKKTDAKKAEKE